jgi:hypothetical protein
LRHSADVVNEPGRGYRLHSAAAFHRLRQEFLPHTDQLSCTVVTADRSPARYIFELNWRKCRAARLTPAHDVSTATRSRIEGDRAEGGFGVLRLPSGPSEESIGPGALALPEDAYGRRLVSGTYNELARPARRATRAPEGFQVVRENGPHDSHFDPVQSLPQQHPAYVGLRCVELGRSLGNG